MQVNLKCLLVCACLHMCVGVREQYMAVNFVCKIASLFVTVNCVKGILLLGSSHLSVRLIVVIVFASSFARTRSANCDSDCDARSAYQLAASTTTSRVRAEVKASRSRVPNCCFGKELCTAKASH